MTIDNVIEGAVIETDWGNAVADEINQHTSDLATINTNGWVTTARINADAVTGAKIADNSINSEHYVNGSIDNAHLAADSVNGAKIANDSIDSEHYVNGSIDNAHLAADSVNGAKIADNSINSEHYVNGSIDAVHLATNSVVRSKLKTSNGVTRRGGGSMTITTTPSTAVNTGGTGISSGSLVIVNVTVDITCGSTGGGAVVAQLSNGVSTQTSELVFVPVAAGHRATLSRTYIVTSSGNDFFQVYVSKTSGGGSYQVNPTHTSIDWVAFEAS